MAHELVAEVVAFLNRPNCPKLTPAERLVLIFVADRANKNTREAWPGGRDDWSLRRLVGVGLVDVLERLARRKLDVRVQLGEDARGRPVYAYRGRQTTYRLPDLCPQPEKGSAVTDPSAEKGSVTAEEGSVWTDPNNKIAEKGSVTAAERVGLDRPLTVIPSRKTTKKKSSSRARARARAEDAIMAERPDIDRTLAAAIVAEIIGQYDPKSIDGYVGYVIGNADLDKWIERGQERLAFGTHDFVASDDQVSCHICGLPAANRAAHGLAR